MNVELIHSGKLLRFSQLDATLAWLIARAPAIAEEGMAEPASRERLLPQPSNDDEFNREWVEFIQPGLEKAILSASELVARDLAELQIRPGCNDHAFDVPLDHADAWLHCLNAARLTLTARHRFADGELAGEMPPRIDSVRELALFQVHLYAVIQECLLAQINPDDC